MRGDRVFAPYESAVFCPGTVGAGLAGRPGVRPLRKCSVFVRVRWGGIGRMTGAVIPNSAVF